MLYTVPVMKGVYAVRASVLAVVLLLGCGDERPPGTAGNESSLVGGPCMNNSECAQRLCEDGSRFPGGMCTVSCGSSSQCPAGSSCGELNSGWVCLVSCRDTSECRQGYSCESVIEAGTNQASMLPVCIGPAS